MTEVTLFPFLASHHLVLLTYHRFFFSLLPCAHQNSAKRATACLTGGVSKHGVLADCVSPNVCAFMLLAEVTGWASRLGASFDYL